MLFKKLINKLLNKIISFNKHQNLVELKKKIKTGQNTVISVDASFQGFLNNITIGDNTKIEGNAMIICSSKDDKIEIGSNCIIKSNTRIDSHGGNIKIGNLCSVNPNSILYGLGGLTIGNHVRIAAHCLIVPANHLFKDINKPIHYQGISKKGIVIEDDVWVGGRVTILDGCIIRKGCVIAAGAVVTKETDYYDIIGGIPAKKIGNRQNLNNVQKVTE